MKNLSTVSSSWTRSCKFTHKIQLDIIKIILNYGLVYVAELVDFSYSPKYSAYAMNYGLHLNKPLKMNVRTRIRYLVQSLDDRSDGSGTVFFGNFSVFSFFLHT